MATTTTMLCECSSLDCSETIELSFEEALRIHQNDLVIIVDGCMTGPDPTDVLVSKKEGYSLYREN